MSAFDTPVLVIGWRRPEHLLEVISALRIVGPSRVWIAVDGPAHSGQLEEVERTRSVATNSIDWPCSIRLLIREDNLGCRRGCAEAIDWFFSEAPEGIILEDDCVPSVEGMLFLQEMLVRYRLNSRVLSVSADNSLGVKLPSKESYFFSAFPLIWGWATWRRAWALYDRDMRAWHLARLANSSTEFFPDRVSERFWTPFFDRVTFEPIEDTWDWQWAATHFIHNGLAVHPTENLVRNIGFDELATHTRTVTSRANARVRGIFPLVHPKMVGESGHARAATYRRFAAVKTGSHPRRPLAFFERWLRAWKPAHRATN
jgi:hypothetical protein